MNGPALYALLHPPPSSSSSSNALSNTTDNDDCDDGGDGGGGLRPRLYVINAVYVRPAGRGKGVGRMLIEAMVRAAEEETAEAVGSEKLSDCAVVIYVEKENVSARRLYESCGFVQISEDEYTGETFRKGVSVALKRDMKTVKS
jgi:ribosomal protein S18 acetylase RimI-like enzyme